MKNFFTVLLVVLCASAFVHAQDYKPTAGNVALEVNFTPLSAQPIGLNYLKTRIFIADDFVFRAGLDFRMNSANSEPTNATNANVTDEEKMSYIQFGIFPGFEKHFGSYERFSPYIGGEIGLTLKSANYEYTDNDANTTTEVSGAWDQTGTNRGFTSFGVNALAGADFYFTKKFYLGAEIGFGVQSVSHKEVETSVGNTTNTVLNKESTMDVGFNFNPAIRLGFSF